MIPSVVNNLRVTTPRVAGLLCAGLGLFVLSGWALDVAWIKSVLPGAVTMKANTAAGFLLAGVALCLLDAEPSRRRWRAGQVLALAVAALGLATLSQFVFDWSLGIDQLLFRDASVVLNRRPGRMSPYTAIALSMLGLGLAAIPSRRLQWLVALAGGVAVLIGGVSFVGYLWNAKELVTDVFAAPVAIHTGIGFILLGAGTLMATRASGEHSPATLQQLSSVERKALGAFLATVILLFAAGGISYRASVRESDSSALVNHTLAVQASLGSLYGDVSDAESHQRNHILSGDAGYLARFESSARSATAEIDALARLVADNEEQTRRLANLRGAVESRIEALRDVTISFERSGLGAAQERIRGGEGQRLMETVRTEIQRMDAIEGDLLIAREAEVARDKVVTLISLLATLTIALVGFLILFRAIQREMRSRAVAERELERFFTISLDFLCIAGADGYFKRISPVVTDVLGWSEEEFLATPFMELVHPDDREATLREVDRQIVSGEKVLRFENRYRHKDGTWRVLSWRSVPQAGGLMYASARDVTELKRAEQALRESEARYRTLFEQIDEGFCIIEMILDAQGKPVDYRFLEINPSFENQTGLADAVGKRMREIAPSHEEHWFEIYGHIAKTGESRRFQNRAEQLHRTYDVYAFRFGDPAKLQVAILFSDITSRRLSEERIEQLNADLRRQAAQLEVANKELEAFSYSVSHDLRAPLRHVQGYVEMLARDSKDVLPEKSRRFLRTITDAAGDMGRLIDDLLSFSRMGRTQMHEGNVDLNALVEEVRTELAHSTASREIRWKVPALPPVRGDRAMLKQVLANLLDNAVKYTRNRSVAEIEIGFAHDGDGLVEFSVRDNGAGFDMKYADKLFGVFQRLHRADEFEGTGIGLANVRRIVARHGGNTRAEGTVDGGATIYFSLTPAAEEPAPQTIS